MSSDCNIDKIKFPIVMNDALQSSVALVLQELVSALEKGKTTFVPPVVVPRTPSPRTVSESHPRRPRIGV